MNIKKGQLLKVYHQRKGLFAGFAERDFDTNSETFFPIALAQKQSVNGYSTIAKWAPGESIPCRNSLCTIEPA